MKTINASNVHIIFKESQEKRAIKSKNASLFIYFPQVMFTQMWLIIWWTLLETRNICKTSFSLKQNKKLQHANGIEKELSV